MIFVIPFLVFMVAVFLLPLGQVGYYSFGGDETELTLKFYESAMTGKLYSTVLLTTLEISVTVAAFTLLPSAVLGSLVLARRNDFDSCYAKMSLTTLP